MGIGGAERVVVALAHGLTARGHEVAVSGAPGVLAAELEGVERLLLPERGRSPLGVAEWALRGAAFIRSWRPHVIHAHNAKATVVAGAAARLARGPRRPRIIATHHGAAARDRNRAARLMRRAADEIVLVSEDLRPAFGPGPIVIHNGITPPPAPAQLDTGGLPLVLWVGRLAAVKNPARFVRAAALVRASARYMVVGDGPLRAEVEALARSLGVEIEFTGARPDARALMGRADLLVVSSDSEGQSLAVLEALAAGTPVVTTPVPGMAGLASVVVEDFTPEALAAGVQDLLQDDARRAAMGTSGAALVSERFSADHMVDAYERRYLTMMPTITN
jgi:glycosyltransferase involved in cell wall biosynthesis